MHEMRTRLWRSSAALVVSFAVLGVLVMHDTAVAKPIRVGVTVSLSGPLAAPATDMLAGMQMWREDVNARGALLGRKVELVSYDDESSPQKSADLYEQMVSAAEVDLLLGPYGSDITYVASSVAERHALPMVSGSASASRIWQRGYQNIFQVDAPAKDYPDLLIESAADAGLSRLALLYEDTAFTREVAAGAREEATAHAMEVVFDQVYQDNSRFGDLIAEIRRAQPDIFIGGTYLDGSLALVREAKRQGFAPRAFAFTVGPALVEFGDALGADAEGVLGIVPWMRSTAIPLAYDFSFRFKERYGRNAGYHAAYGYAAGQVLEAAVRLAGSLDKDAVRRQLGEMKFTSLMGHYRVDETGAQLGKRTFVMQWQAGRRLLVLPKEFGEADIEYPFPPWSAR